MEASELSVSLENHLAGKLLANGRYKLLEQIGSGSFGKIYIAEDTIEPKKVAVKLELNKSHKQLSIEWDMYLYLAQNNPLFIPVVYYYGEEEDYNVLVMQLLGRSLEGLFKSCARQFSLKTTLMLADEMIGQIEYIHNRGIVHRDIKPDNLLMGSGKQSHHVFFIDYGLSKKYYDIHSQSHVSYKKGYHLMGTLRYCSVSTHLGVEQGRRDDLEAIGYILVYFAKGSLPWQGLWNPQPDAIARLKMSTMVDVLCEGLPSEFASYINYTRALKFKETPNYAYLRNLFRWIFSRLGYSNDYVYDWKLRKAYENARQEEWERSNPKQKKHPLKSLLVKKKVPRAKEELTFLYASS